MSANDTLVLTIACGILSVIAILAACYSFGRWKVHRVRMPVGVWILLLVGGLAAMWGLLASALAHFLDLSMGNAVAIPFIVFGSIWFFVWLVVWTRNRRLAGELLIDCGPNPARSRFPVIAAVNLLIGAGGIVRCLEQLDGIAAALVVAGVSGTAMALAVAFGRLQFRENGIWRYGDLLKWGRLSSYEWDGANDCELRLQTKPFAFLRKDALSLPALPVSLEQKPLVDEILQQHVAVAVAVDSPENV